MWELRFTRRSAWHYRVWEMRDRGAGGYPRDARCRRTSRSSLPPDPHILRASHAAQ